jgi:hypothetical protein
MSEEYDKGWVDGSDAQNESCQEHIIKPLIEALEGMLKSYNKVWMKHVWYTGEYELLPSEVAKSVVDAEEVLAKCKGKP